jgi:hypothetical protein
VDYGLYAAKKRFFLSWFVWTEVGGTMIPTFPGGVACMSALAVNLLVGGLWRLKISGRTAGVVIIHVGIAFMLVASVVKLVSADEGHLSLFEGEQAAHFDSYHLYEVAVWEAGGSGDVIEHVIDHEYISDLTGGRTRRFTFPDLPFELVLSSWVPNCDVQPKGPMWKAAGPTVDGYALRELPPEKEAETNVPGIHVEALVDGESQRGILWGPGRIYRILRGIDLPWTVRADGRAFAVDLRPARFPMPFGIHLEDFEKEEHPGTGIPKFFRSHVTKLEQGEQERVLIEMNEPLRSEGLVLFQSGWGPQGLPDGARLFSTFSVVDNPSDKWPEYALWVITLGLLVVFGRKLLGFLRSQNKKHAEQAEAAR